MKNRTNITDILRVTIDRIEKGIVFTYEDFIAKVNNKEAIIKALNRMVTNGKIRKLSKGRYYKPEISKLGELQPSNYQVVKDLLSKDGKTIGYLTGYSVYNELGLTNQVSNIIQVAKNDTRPSMKRGNYNISFIRQKNTITKTNILLFQILDSIRYIKKIPDSSLKVICTRLLSIINDLSKSEEKTIVRLSLKYPPATRALLGTLLEELKRTDNLQLLLESLNPITKYELSAITEILPKSKNWNFE